MKMRQSYRIFSLILISVLVCSSGFAQSGQTNIPIPENLVTYQSAESGVVFTQVQLQFDWVMGQLDLIKAQPGLSDVEKAQIDNVKGLLRDKKRALQAVDVYFGNPGATFDDLSNYYTGQGIALEDLGRKPEDTASERQRMGIAQALGQVPDTFLAKTLKDELDARLDTLEAAGGAKGTSHMTISTVFVRPNPNSPAEPAIEDKIVLIIASQ